MKLFLALVLAALIPSAAMAYGPCDGQIDGVWGYKGGRDMTLIVDSDGGNRVAVIVNQRNGSEVTNGTCRLNRDGSASLSFRGRANSGRLVIYRNGYAQGSVSGFSFRGNYR
jgi:hypothetical protein